MKHKLITTAGLLATSLAVNAQSVSDSTDTLPLVKKVKSAITMDEFVVSASKFKENKKNVVQNITVISKKEMKWINSQTTPTLLEQSGNVFVQRSQMGGGSPVIRGFEANKIQLVIDGVRMNNAIYRGGHLQNLVTVDNYMLQSMEILYGPASTLYGSDALGGVIVMTTLQPKLNSYAGNGMLRYSSANNEMTGHADFSIGGKKWASLTGVTYSKFDDLRQGAQRNPFYNDFGARNYYVDRINGVDSIVANPNKNVQKFTGYEQVDVLQKVMYKSGEHTTHILNLQLSNTSNVPRYDRLTDLDASGKLRFAEWSYGPQLRGMGSYQLNIQDMKGWFDELKATASYQIIEESRIQRTRGRNNRQSRIENLDVAGFNIDLRKKLNNHEFTFGADGQYNNVKSTAKAKDIVTGKESALDTRYPDGGSNMLLAAVYAQHIYKIVPNKWVINDGIRLNYTQLDATFKSKEFFPLPYNKASQQNTALSGNLGVIYMPSNSWRIALGGSTGFRSPNVDDLAKVFESSGGVSVVVPNANLKPEYSYNADLNISYLKIDKVKLEGSLFYTWLDNAIVVDKFTFNGQDSIDYNGKRTAVVASQNKASAFIYGGSAAISAQLNDYVTFMSSITYTYGRYKDAKGTESPLDHIPPVFGRTGIQYKRNQFKGEVYALYNGWKNLKDYSTSGEDNLNYATPLGMPAWYTLNAKASYNVCDNFNLTVALENILDQNYRQFASGLSAPGRNLVITARVRL